MGQVKPFAYRPLDGETEPQRALLFYMLERYRHSFPPSDFGATGGISYYLAFRGVTDEVEGGDVDVYLQFTELHVKRYKRMHATERLSSTMVQFFGYEDPSLFGELDRILEPFKK